MLYVRLKDLIKVERVSILLFKSKLQTSASIFIEIEDYIDRFFL